MATRIQILAIIASLFLMGTTTELIRRRQLEEKYAISWLLTSIFFLICSINFEVINFLSRLTGIISPPNCLFLLAFFFLIIVTLSLTVIASNEARRSRKLAQEISILKFDVEELNRRLGHTSSLRKEVKERREAAETAETAEEGEEDRA